MLEERYTNRLPNRRKDMLFEQLDFDRRYVQVLEEENEMLREEIKTLKYRNISKAIGFWILFLTLSYISYMNWVSR